MGNFIRHIVRRAYNATMDEEHDTDKAWNEFKQRLHDGRRKRNEGYRVLGYAATVIILLSIGMYVWFSLPGKLENDYPGTGTIVCPGVELILANGERIQFGQQGKDITVEGLGVRIFQDEGEEMVCYQTDSSGGRDQNRFNELNVPKGGEFRLKLSDGSVVYLNSESTLRFPVDFASDNREVYLEGEAFFDVTKDEKASFKVHTGDKTITVLGTRFNVSAYPDDAFWQTTLVEGKVSVLTEGSERVLFPSQQYSICNETREVEVKTVDTGLFTSWMEGKFYFKGYRLEDVMKTLARWYDFEVKYEQEDVKNMRFRGVIDKDRSLEETLRFLEATTSIAFDIEGKIIIIRAVDK